MSVTKDGGDDRNCGYTTKDPAPPGDLPGGRRRDHGRRRGRQRRHSATHNIPASYDEVITVSALADTDGRPGGLGGNRCYSWGGYDKDDTFADFSNYGHDVDIIAPGKCIMSTIPGPRLRVHVGHVHGGPDRDRRRGAVQVQSTERDPGRGPRGAALPRQPQLEGLDRPGSDPRAAARRVAHRAARDIRPDPGLLDQRRPPRAAGSKAVPFTLARSATFFERVQAVDHVAADRLDRDAPVDQPDGLDRDRGPGQRHDPDAARPRAPTTSASAAPTRVARSRARSRSPSPRTIRPRSPPTTMSLVPGSTIGMTDGQDPRRRGRRRPTRQPRSPATRSSGARTAAPGTAPRIAVRGDPRRTSTPSHSTPSIASASAPSTPPATGARGPRWPDRAAIHPYDDRSTSDHPKRKLARRMSSTRAFKSTLSGSIEAEREAVD